MNVVSRTRLDVQETASAWLGSFGEALRSGDAAAAASHFAADGHWRDVLAFTWRLQTESGLTAIEAALAPTLARTRADGFHFPAGRSAPRRVRRAGTECQHGQQHGECKPAFVRAVANASPGQAHAGPCDRHQESFHQRRLAREVRPVVAEMNPGRVYRPIQ